MGDAIIGEMEKLGGMTCGHDKTAAGGAAVLAGYRRSMIWLSAFALLVAGAVPRCAPTPIPTGRFA